jgi:hypothetical protein
MIHCEALGCETYLLWGKEVQRFADLLQII